MSFLGKEGPDVHAEIERHDDVLLNRTLVVISTNFQGGPCLVSSAETKLLNWSQLSLGVSRDAQLEAL